MDSRSFEISELGESKKEDQIRSKLLNADQKVKQQLEEAENWQKERIMNEQVKNQYYRNEIENIKQEMNQLQSPPTSNKQTSKNNMETLDAASPSEDPFNSTERNQINYHNQLQNMYQQQTNVHPRVFEYDMNKNNANLQNDIVRQQYEQDQLNQLYQQANQQRQEVLNSNYYDQNYYNNNQQNQQYRINKENDKLRAEVNELQRVNQLTAQMNQQLQIDENVLRYQNNQFQQQIKQNFENEYLDKLMNNQRYVDNNFGSDKVASNSFKEAKLEQLVKSVKQKVNKSLREPNKSDQFNRFDPSKLTQKQVGLLSKEQGKKDILIRGPRDQLDLKIFGQRRQCKECTFLLSKGLSSQFCQDCGSYKEKQHPSRQLPKRFSGVL